MPSDTRVAGGYQIGQIRNQIKQFKVKSHIGKDVSAAMVKEILEYLTRAALVQTDGDGTDSTRFSKFTKFSLTRPAALLLFRLNAGPPEEGFAESRIVHTRHGFLDFPELTPKEKKRIAEGTVAIPGATLIGGDHSVVLGGPAVYLPIPLHLALRFVVSRNELKKGIEVFVHSSQPDQEQSFEHLLDPPDPVQYNDASGVIEFFKKRLKTISVDTRLPRDLYVTLQVKSQIPSNLGLGSSGAFCVALALVLHSLKRRKPLELPLGGFESQSAESLVKNDDFLDVYAEATLLERKIHGKSSGVGPFASLVGSLKSLPSRFQIEKGLEARHIADLDSGDGEGWLKRSREVLRWMRHVSLPVDSAERWHNEFAVANVYTGNARPSSADILGERGERAQEHWNRLTRFDCQLDLRSTTDKIWDNIVEGDWPDVVESINIYNSFEKGYLKMMIDEPVARGLGAHFYNSGLGAKYTGFGFGGDLLVAGPREQMKKSLVPNYYPVHYLTYGFDARALESQPKLGAIPYWHDYAWHEEGLRNF